jgi:predicted ATPase
MLVYLVEHPGELVTKQALLQAIWPGTAVAEGVLTTGMGGSARRSGKRRSSHSTSPPTTDAAMGPGHISPIDAVLRNHPVSTLTQELRLHGQCTELPLRYLSETGVVAYLAGRFTPPVLPDSLGRSLHQRTNGNPLFLVTMVDGLVQQGRLREGAVEWELTGDLTAVEMSLPEGLRQLIVQHLERLAPPEQEVLEAASVAGAEFTVAAVAACLQRSVEDIDAHCAAFARRGQFLQACGTDAWPDGTIATHYRFIHDLYRGTLYDRVPGGRRRQSHQHIGARLEAGYGACAREIASELAEHFVRGHDAPRAVRYLQYAGEQALQRNAYREAVMHLMRGLKLLPSLPDTPHRAQRELSLQAALGSASMATKGQAAPACGNARAASNQRVVQQVPTAPSPVFP